MTDQKPNRKKARKERKKLCRAVDTLASIVDSTATTMKGEIESGKAFDIKQLKELTGAAKELSALICALDEGTDDNGSAGCVFVSFESEGEEWAK